MLLAVNRQSDRFNSQAARRSRGRATDRHTGDCARKPHGVVADVAGVIVATNDPVPPEVTDTVATGAVPEMENTTDTCLPASTANPNGSRPSENTQGSPVRYSAMVAFIGVTTFDVSTRPGSVGALSH